MSKIAIFTNFKKFDPWYSLTGIVKDQARMLAEYGNDTHVIADEQCSRSNFLTHGKLHRLLPSVDLYDYQDGEELSALHMEYASNLAVILESFITNNKIDTVFSHDWIFTGWNRPYALAIQIASRKLSAINWFHWIHSIPSTPKSWWHLSNYGPHHWIVYPNRTDTMRVAEAYRTNPAVVKVIPHIKDLRIMFEFSDTTCRIIEEIPALMYADIVQIYPASSDRFEAKGVSKVIKILGNIKALGHSVCLFIANQWATTAKQYADINKYHSIAREAGLIPGHDVIFSSNLKDYDFKYGVPWRQLRELMQLANLFVFPTSHETFGLVLPEVSLCSGALCILNRSLQMQAEIAGNNTLFFDFGSYTHNFEPEDMDDYLRQVALIILGRMQENDSLLTRTFMRKHYNYDHLYSHYYGPIIEEAKIYE